MIEVEHLYKRYGATLAVRDLSFTVARGSITGFLGPNGAGKSTTLRIVAGFLGASSGRVRIDGRDIVDERLAALGRIGYMPETSPLYPEMRVREYLRFRAELKRVPRARRAVELGRVLEAARVADMADVRIGHLSKGYRQRVGLADALIGSPSLLILDEPTAGLDPNQIREVRALIHELEGKHTVLLSTHILSEVEATCSEAVVIARGELVAAGTIDAIRAGRGAAALAIVVAGESEPALELLRARAEVKDARERAEGDPRLPVEGKLLAIELAAEPLAERGVGPITEALVAALAGAGIGVRGVLPAAASLEHVFAELTRDEPPQAEAPAAPKTKKKKRETT